jgi:hypothetical protein
MAFMFNENVFNQDLSKWNVTLVSSCNGFAGGSFTLPRPNFINCTP